MQTWELTVHGRVQGVGFRWHVLRCAERHNIKGYVRNQFDSTVLIIAQAAAEDYKIFIHSVENDFSRANIRRIDAVKIDHAKSYNDFTIR